MSYYYRTSSARASDAGFVLACTVAAETQALYMLATAVLEDTTVEVIAVTAAGMEEGEATVVAVVIAVVEAVMAVVEVVMVAVAEVVEFEVRIKRATYSWQCECSSAQLLVAGVTSLLTTLPSPIQ